MGFQAVKFAKLMFQVEATEEQVVPWSGILGSGSVAVQMQFGSMEGSAGRRWVGRNWLVVRAARIKRRDVVDRAMLKCCIFIAEERFM